MKGGATLMGAWAWALLLLAVMTVAVPFGVLLAWSPGTVEPYLDASGQVRSQSIAEKSHVDINGAQLGMFIKGKDIRNPVVLFLHGGPGMPEYFLADRYPTGLEEAFTVCYLEQRGAGLSYRAGMTPESITVEQLIRDVLAVTRHLRQRFGQQKIFLLAHSWGTLLGVQAAAREPTLFHAYVGVAQIVDMRESERRAYRFLLREYQARGDSHRIRALQAFPVLQSDAGVRDFFFSSLRDTAMHELGLGTTHQMTSVITGIFIPLLQCPAYTLREKLGFWRAKAFLRSRTGLVESLLNADLATTTPVLGIPAYFLSGRLDVTVNRELAQAYAAALGASFYSFEASAHSPMFEEPLRFMNVMVNDVLRGTHVLADR